MPQNYQKNDLIAVNLAMTNGQTFNLDNLQKQWSVLYFYPKDATPGCTTEGKDFSALQPDFNAQQAQILGVSRDSIESHQRFKAKQNFTFELISDPDDILCRAFGVIQEKKNFGKTYMGIVRSTFLINPQGDIVQSWQKVRVKGHAQVVLEALKANKMTTNK